MSKESESIRSRMAALRKGMAEQQIDALYISGTDPHGSEYLPDRWQTRRLVTGFTGSFGEVAITAREAGLWTDSRYFLQAEAQLQGTGITLHKLRVPEAVPPAEWLAQNLPAGSHVGIDPFSLPLGTYRQFRQLFAGQNLTLTNASGLLDKVWHDRPAYPGRPIFELDLPVTGETRTSKIDRINALLKERNASLTIISALDDLAWTFNLRGSDVEYNPVFTGYAVVGNGVARLFVNRAALGSQLQSRLASEGITPDDYENFFPFLETLSGTTVSIDPASACTAIFQSLNNRCQLVEATSVPALLKAVKNETEQEGFRQAMRKDGAALVEFLFWLKKSVGKIPVTEYTAGRKLAELRAKQPGFAGESFAPLVGYRDHGAMVHLSVEADNANPLEPEGLLLFDSGGQYNTGTTDVTRTVALGPLTDRQKTDYTLVLKGMIALSMAKFPAGTKGVQLDLLARQHLWQNGLNYGHGTGHGVGHFLCVHEGPASIRPEPNPHELKPGMVFSNEPGLYRTGEYGIRTENMILCRQLETTGFGQFLGFETLTLCPIDTAPVVTGLLTAEERNWLNSYHQQVFRELSPLLTTELQHFLAGLTQPI